MSTKKLNYHEFHTHLTNSQWNAFAYLIVTHETSPDQECDIILGKYLDSIKVPNDFNASDILDGDENE